MTTFTPKNLGQVTPAANTDTTLYTVPGATSADVSSIVVANTADTETTFRVAHRLAGAALTGKQYLAYEIPVAGKATVVLRAGVLMAATDVLTVRAAAAGVAFNVYGQEAA